MNAENGGFVRCVRHPSLFFTGICSSCLAERLSNVDSGDKNPNGEQQSSGAQSEIVEISCSGSEAARKPNEGRVRKTLQSLFELDDITSSNDHHEIKKVDFVNGNFETGKMASGSWGDADATRNTKAGTLKYEDLRSRGVPFWWGSVFSKKATRQNVRSSSEKNSMNDRSCCSGFGGRQMEGRPRVRQSCDWGDSRDSGKPVWEVPRHSWDGSVMSKALSCSFACLEEPFGGSSHVKRDVDDSTTTTDANLSNSYADTEVNTLNSNEKSLPPESNLGGIRERGHQESHQEIAVSGICRKKSNRWNRVWDWSITSPFRDFTKKREHILERSLSESWRDSRKEMNVEKVVTDSQMKTSRNGLTSAQMHQFVNRSTNAVNGDVPKVRPDWQKKREFKLIRSRSVHYSSPGNMDNGLLRFYLTPLRSSRRRTRKGMPKTSRTSSKGVLGL